MMKIRQTNTVRSYFGLGVMMAFVLTVVTIASLVGSSTGFVPKQNYINNNNNKVVLFALPTIEQLSKDPFMKQVQYGYDLTNELLEATNNNNDNDNDNDDDDDNALKESIQAQLSHSDGIRGFMVSYLTADTSPADNEIVPTVLLDALKTQADKDPEDLIPLTCMNVIMPVAMTTMHSDPELAANSAKTAKRGIRVLQALATSNKVVTTHAKAILAVATKNDSNNDDDGTDESTTTMATANDNENADPKLIKLQLSVLNQYWEDFFEKWGYREIQKKDIASAMKQVLELQHE